MPKSLVVVLAAVAVLTLVLLGVGSRSEPGSADPAEHSWAESFRLDGAPPVEVEHFVSSECFERAARRFALPATASCTTRIAPVDGPIRLLELAPESATSRTVRVDYVPDGDGVEIDEWDPEGDDFPLQVPVGPGGGTLTLRCRVAVGGCALRVPG
jgi:hypothetical protein